MNSKVLSFADSIIYDDETMDIDYFRNMIANTFNVTVDTLIRGIDDLLDAQESIVDNASEVMIEVFDIPEDFSTINQIIRNLIIDNEIENFQQYEEIILSRDLDMKELISEGVAYVDNNVYSNRHFILRYQLNLEAYEEFINNEI